MWHTLTLISLFLRRLASVDTCQLGTPTYRSIKFSDQWESVFHSIIVFMVECVALAGFLWWRVLLLMNRKTTTVTFTAFISTKVLVWRNSCTSQFPKTSRATPATIGKRWVKPEPSSSSTCRLPKKRYFYKCLVWVAEELQQPIKIKGRVLHFLKSSITANCPNLGLLNHNTSRKI
jgi:hypothetical protein